MMRPHAAAKPRELSAHFWLEPKSARCVAKHPVTVLQSGRSWHPSSRDSAVQELIGSRPAIPHGDRRELAQSRRVVDEYELICSRTTTTSCVNSSCTTTSDRAPGDAKRSGS